MTFQTDRELEKQIERGYKIFLDQEEVEAIFPEFANEKIHMLMEAIESVDLSGDPRAISQSFQEQTNLDDDQIIKLLNYTILGYSYRGNPPIDTNRGDPPIKNIALYFMSFDQDSRLIVREYKRSSSGRITKADARTEFKKLAVEARKNLLPEGWGFANTNWSDPCYLALVMDSETWDFHRETTGQKRVNALHFASRVPDNEPNNSFYNGENFDVDIDGNGAMRTVFMCTNQHWSPKYQRRRKKGDILVDNYKFDIFFRVGLSPKMVDQNGDEIKKTIILDPTGTNMGPNN